MPSGIHKTDIPVLPLRAAYERSGRTAGDIARDVQFICADGHTGRTRPDSSRVTRMLGIHSYRSHGKQLTRTHMKYDNALKLARALGVDPIDVGL